MERRLRRAAAVHSGLSTEERGEIGISDRLLRFSVGLEDPANLFVDLEPGLEAAGG